MAPTGCTWKPVLHSEADVVYGKEEMLFVRQRLKACSEQSDPGCLFRSIDLRFGDATPEDCVKRQSGESTCSTGEDSDELEQVLNPKAPEFVPREAALHGQTLQSATGGKPCRGRHNVGERTLLCTNAGKAAAPISGGGLARVLTASAMEFIPRQNCSWDRLPNPTPGLSASDVAFILNVSLPEVRVSGQSLAFSADASEFVPRSTQPNCAQSQPCSVLSAGASEFVPEVMQTNGFRSKPDHALVSGIAECTSHSSVSSESECEAALSAAAAEFFPPSLKEQSVSPMTELSFSAKAAEFVPRSLTASDKPVSVRDLASQFYLHEGGALTSSGPIVE